MLPMPHQIPARLSKVLTLFISSVQFSSYKHSPSTSALVLVAIPKPSTQKRTRNSESQLQGKEVMEPG